MSATTYQVIPEKIEAMQWAGSAESQAQIIAWAGPAVSGRFGYRYGHYYLSVDTGKGGVAAIPGDFIVKHENGCFAVWKQEAFEARYAETA